MASYDASTLIGMYTAGQDRRNAEIDRRYALEDRARKIKAEEERKALLKDLFTGGGQSASAQPATSTPSLQTQFVGQPSVPPSVSATAPQKTIGAHEANIMRQSLGDKRYQAWKVKNGIMEEGEVAPIAPAPPSPAVGGPEEPMMPPADANPAPRINQQALAKLLVVDPETGTSIINAFAKMDENQRKTMDDKFNAMGSVAYRLQTVPIQQRAQEFQRAIQFLRAKGWTDQELQNANLSDQGLATYAKEVVDVKTLMQEARQAASDAETARHNRVSEGQDAARIDLSRKRENRITKWGPTSINIIGGGVRTDTSDLDY